MNKLDEICALKREHVAAQKQRFGIAALSALATTQSAPRGFRAAIEAKAATGFALIAEIKKASPSKGLIRDDFHPAGHAAAYAGAGAACLSVLTDKPYFQGDDSYLAEARNACTLPALRKDFMVDPWQVLEARALEADAILIIMAALDDGLAAEIEAAALDLGMDALIEVHDEAELERALRLKSRLIGVNNRDLRTFQTDIMTSRRLATLAPPDVLLVSESGINHHDDLIALSQFGIRAFLVGESLMRQNDVAAATRALLVGA